MYLRMQITTLKQFKMNKPKECPIQVCSCKEKCNYADMKKVKIESDFNIRFKEYVSKRQQIRREKNWFS